MRNCSNKKQKSYKTTFKNTSTDILFYKAKKILFSLRFLSYIIIYDSFAINFPEERGQSFKNYINVMI